MKKRMFLMLAAVALLFGGIFGFKAVGNYFMNQYFDTMTEPPATITAAEVKEDHWTPTVQAVGSFTARNGAELTTEVGGIVTAIHFENGAAVEAGQRLVSLDTDADEAELERLRAVARLAELEEERFQRLRSENSVSESELQRRESEAAQARAAVRGQEARIRQKTIRSPFDGVAGIRRVNLGQYVAPGTPAVAVESLDPLYLNFFLPEQRLSDLHPGQTVEARVDSFPNQTFTGEVTAIEPRVRESTRTVEIQATFANPDENLRPGMYARVSLVIGEPAAVLVIPQTAIQYNPYGNSVYVLFEEVSENGDEESVSRVRQRFIQTGERRGDLVTVLGGLDTGDRVASSGLLKLRNNARVEISDNGDLQPSSDLNPRPANN